VRQSQGQLDLVVDGLGISTALDGSAEHGGTGPQGRASEAEGVHFAMVGGMQRPDVSLLKVAVQRSKSERRLFPSGSGHVDGTTRHQQYNVLRTPYGVLKLS
jgi:hypothetical protein